jgi:hypothetical protein
MTIRRWSVFGAGLLVAGACATSADARPQAPAPAAPKAAPAPQAAPAPDPSAAPANLKPLLLPRQSELRLVVTRYTLDRQTLAGNYVGGMRGMGGGGGRGPGAPGPQSESLSPDRLKRLRRFDLDWQDALAKLDRPALSPEAAKELDGLKLAVAANLMQVDAEWQALEAVLPAVPFAPPIVRLVEDRIRLKDINAERAAGEVDTVAQAIERLKAQVESALATGAPADAPKMGKALALKAAAATDTLRAALAEWFAFYNGYDPQFSWWVPLPYKKADAALKDYAALLRDKVAPADEATSAVFTIGHATSTPAAGPAPSIASVPDLAAVIALPQDEMTDIVQRFRGTSGRGGRGGGGAAPAGPAPRGGVSPRARARGAAARLHRRPRHEARPSTRRGWRR